MTNVKYAPPPLWCIGLAFHAGNHRENTFRSWAVGGAARAIAAGGDFRLTRCRRSLEAAECAHHEFVAVATGGRFASLHFDNANDGPGGSRIAFRAILACGT